MTDCPVPTKTDSRNGFALLHSGSLVRYLEPFAHTVAVMQDSGGPAPGGSGMRGGSRHGQRGMPRSGSRPNCTSAAGCPSTMSSTPCWPGSLTARSPPRRWDASRCAAWSPPCGMPPGRSTSPSWRFGSATGAWWGSISPVRRRVSASRHLDAFEYMRANNARFTIHAGEAFGLPSIHEALAFLRADRLGPWVRITDDIEVLPDGTASFRLAALIRTREFRWRCVRVPMCRPARCRASKHPFDLLARLRFRVTVNTDNRLMSDTTMSRGDVPPRRRRSGTGGVTSSGSPSTR